MSTDEYGNGSDPIDPKVLAAVESCGVSLHHFRQSAKLKSLLAQLIDLSVMHTLKHCWAKQSVKIRLDAIMRLLVSMLVIPTLSSIVGVGKQFDLDAQTVFPDTYPDPEQSLHSPATTPSTRGSRLIQAESHSEPTLLANLKNVLVSTLSMFQQAEEQTLAMGSDVSLDGRRAFLFTRIINLRSSRFIPLVITLSEHGGDLLECLTCHILCVRALSVDINVAISNLLAGLRGRLLELDDEDPALSRASTPQVSPFSTPKSMPASQSIPRSGLSASLFLSSASSPSTSSKSEEANANRIRALQVIADGVCDYFSFVRENYDELVASCRSTEIAASVDPRVRAWLRAEEYESSVELLRVFFSKYRQHLTHLPVPLQPFKSSDIAQAKRDVCREIVVLNKISYGGCDNCTGLIAGIDSELDKVLRFLFESDFVSNTADLDPTSARSNTSAALKYEDDEEGGGVIDDDLYDLRATTLSQRSEELEVEKKAKQQQQQQQQQEETLQQGGEKWHEELKSMILSQILLAASRTAAGGDAFFIVNDLYGGEGLVLCPCSEWGKSGTEGLRVPSPFVSPINKKPETKSTSANTGGANVTISISIKGVRVVVYNWYSLFSREELEASSDGTLPPLVSFRCTTTTLLVLSPANPVDGEEIRGGLELYTRLGTSPETVVKRAISIEPFIEVPSCR